MERWKREWNQNNVYLASSSYHQYGKPPWCTEYTSRGSNYTEGMEYDDDDQHNYIDFDSFFPSEYDSDHHSSTDSASEGDDVSNDDTVDDSSETRRPPPPSTSLTLLTPSGGTGKHLGEASEGDDDVSDNGNVDDSSEGENEDGDGAGSYGDSEDDDSREDGNQSGNEATACEKDCMRLACMYVDKDHYVACRLAELYEEAMRTEKIEKDLAAQREQNSKALFDAASEYESRPEKYLATLRELKDRKEKNDYLQPSSMQQPISPPSERMKISDATWQQTRATSASKDTPVSPMGISGSMVKDQNPYEEDSSAIKSESIFDSNFNEIYATLKRDVSPSSPPQPPCDDFVSEKCMKVRGFKPPSTLKSMASSHKRKETHTADAIVELPEPSSKSLRTTNSPLAIQKNLNDFFPDKRTEMHTARSTESSNSRKTNEARAKASLTKKTYLHDFFSAKRTEVPASTARSIESSNSRKRNKAHAAAAIDKSSEPLSEFLRTTKLSSTQKCHGSDDDFFSDEWMKVRFEPASTTRSAVLSRSSKINETQAAAAINESTEPLSESLRITKLSSTKKCHGSDDDFSDVWMKVYRPVRCRSTELP